MKKIVSIVLMTCLFPLISLELGTIDANNGSIEILINSTEDIRGFQFDLCGVDLTAGSGGQAELYGFEIYAGGDTVLGFSLEGLVMPATSGVLTVLQGTITGDVCLPFIQNTGPEEDTPIFAGQNGEALVDIEITEGSECDEECNLAIDDNLNFNLFETYPNPFNPELNINVNILQNDYLDILVYNVNGQMITTIYSGLISGNQIHNFTWDASNFSSGIYIIKVDSDNFTQSKIVNLLK